MMSEGLAMARRYPLPWRNQTKRSMLGANWTIWSKQYPTASLGKIVVGSNCVKVTPSDEYAAVQLAVAKMTPPPVTPPLGSAHTASGSPLQPWPAEVIPIPLLTSKTISGGSPTGLTEVPPGGGVVRGTKGAVGTVQ